MKQIIRECYEQLYANKLDGLDEMDEFLTQMIKINALKNGKSEQTITCKETELVIKHLPIKKNPILVGLTREFYQIFKEEIIACFYKLYQKITKEVGTGARDLEKQVSLGTCGQILYQQSTRNLQ